jgi:hypothetical protein
LVGRPRARRGVIAGDFHDHVDPAANELRNSHEIMVRAAVPPE